MSRTRIRSGIVLAGLTAAFGCQANTPAPAGKTPPGTSHAEPKALTGLDELPPADRELAKAQKTCPVSGHPLGSMGAPVKLMLKGTPVFVCCEGCTDSAVAHADATVKKAEDMRTGR